MPKTRTGARPASAKRLRGSTGAFVALSALTAPPAKSTSTSRLDSAAGPPCHLCTARCCKYFALAIDTPVTPEDHDYNRWFLMHAHVVIWQLDGDWYLEVRTPCTHLQPDNSCGVYETRPQVCRDYGLPEKADDPQVPCEYFAEEAGYDLFFDTAEAYEAWARVQIQKRAERLARRRRRRREKMDAEGSREAIA